MLVKKYIRTKTLNIVLGFSPPKDQTFFFFSLSSLPPPLVPQLFYLNIPVDYKLGENVGQNIYPHNFSLS